MPRQEWMDWIYTVYNVRPDAPWQDTPENLVFRHRDTKKWFALILRVRRDKLGLSGTQPLDILNVKCDTRMLGSFLQLQGVFPAYHMCKRCWLSIALDGSVPRETVAGLLDMSYSATASGASDREKTL